MQVSHLRLNKDFEEVRKNDGSNVGHLLVREIMTEL